MPRFELPKDTNYHVEDCPPSVKGKITELIHAAMEYAFIGTQDPEHRGGIQEDLLVSRYNLERTIATKLKGR